MSRWRSSNVGQITIVTLSDNIASARECRSVQEQLDRLIAAGRCNLVLDFSGVKKLAIGFRDVLVHVTEAAREQARTQGNVGGGESDLGARFRIFGDREAALAEMSRHAGHGWVVLCAVPVGIRAVSG